MSLRRHHTDHWPPNQWHAAYSSIKDWLENEAPVASPLVHETLTGNGKKPRFRILRRRT
jgi:hypothetical protein